MDLSDGDLAVIRSWVGSKPTDEDIRARYDRLGSVDSVILEILQSQRSALLENPASISAPDGSSLSFQANIQAIQAKIKEFRDQGGTAGTADETVGTVISKLKRPEYR